MALWPPASADRVPTDPHRPDSQRVIQMHEIGAAAGRNAATIVQVEEACRVGVSHAQRLVKLAASVLRGKAGGRSARQPRGRPGEVG